MDDITKAALEIAVEQLEEAERIIEALTEENVRLKQEAATNGSWARSTWATGTSVYPRQQVTWTTSAPTNSTVTHVALYNASTAAANASTALVNLTAQTKRFDESLQKLRKRYEEMHFENEVS